MAKKKAVSGAPEVVPEIAVEYAVVHRLSHDGELYKRGELIELVPSQAASLLQLGVIKEIPVAVKEAE